MRACALYLAGVLAFCLPAGSIGQEAPLVSGETGTVEGTVRDALGAPVPGATVRLRAGVDIFETMSDAVGRYVLEGAPVGERAMDAESPRGEIDSAAVTVAPGATVTQDFTVIEEENVIVVRAKLLSGTTRDTILKTRIASGVGDYFGKKDIDLSGGSDPTDVIVKKPSVTIQDGKYAFIRGLGGRYSQTLVNGSSIPSPEPDRRVIPLDLFPVSVVESIVIAKTYSPDRPGEFSGGTVMIETVEVPEERFLKLGVSFDYRVGSTFQEFRTYDGGTQDIFTVADATRDLPDAVPDEVVRVGALTDEQVQEIGRSFKNIWEPSSITAPPDHKLSISFGDSSGTPGIGPGRVGVVGAVNWGNKYSTIEDEEFRVLKNAGTAEEPAPFVFNDFTLQRYTFESELSGVLNTVYEYNEGQKFGWRNLYTRSATDRVLEQAGIDGQQDREIRITQLRYVERSLWTTQLYGENLVVGDLFLKWRGSYNLSQRDEPDNRQVRYDFRDFTGEFTLENVSGSGRRDYYQLDENIWDGGVDLQIPLSGVDGMNFLGVPDRDQDPQTNEHEQKIQLGVAGTLRDRDFDARRFRFIPSTVGGRPTDEAGNPIDLTASPEDIFREKNINSRGFVLSEVTRTTDNYEAEQTLLAAYGLIDLRLHDRVRLETGIRAEDSDQSVTTFELFGDPPQEVEGELDELDYMPAFNLTWEFLRESDEDDAGGLEESYWRKDMQLRLAGSQTVSRPEIRELAAFEFTDVGGGYAARGNPDLDRAKIWNLDLRWEWYPGPGDLLSSGLFYKRFDEPIEQIIIPTGSALITSWDNADVANLWGFEFEIRKNLGFINEKLLRNLTVLVNYAWITSEVEIAEGGIAIQTNDKRELQGQPDFTFNTGLIYDDVESGLTVTLFANTSGESISAVGADGVPDEKLQPRWSLDFSIGKRFQSEEPVAEEFEAKESKERARGPVQSVKFSAENLLNDDYEWKQGTETTSKYDVGIKLGISYSVSF